MRRRSVSENDAKNSAWSWRWFWERFFDEFEARDYFVVAGAVMFFALIWCEKINGDHLASIVAALAGYALGRPYGGGRSG